MSVFVGTDRNTGIAFEDDNLSETKTVYGGYAQSKWAAEVLLRAAPKSLPIDIYRFGLLTGDVVSGRFPARDQFAMTVRGLTRLQCVPQDVDHLEVDITPVDFAARAMVSIACDQMTPDNAPRAAACETWHIANPESLPAGRLFDVLSRTCPEVERVSHAEFLQRVKSQTDSDQAAACLSLSQRLSADDSHNRSGPLDLFQATGITFDMTRTQQVLSRAGLRCPRPDEPLIRRYLSGILQ